MKVAFPILGKKVLRHAFPGIRNISVLKKELSGIQEQEVFFNFRNTFRTEVKTQRNY